MNKMDLTSKLTKRCSECRPGSKMRNSEGRSSSNITNILNNTCIIIFDHTNNKTKRASGKENEEKGTKVSKAIKGIMGNIHNLLGQKKPENQGENTTCARNNKDSTTPCRKPVVINSRNSNRAVSVLKNTRPKIPASHFKLMPQAKCPPEAINPPKVSPAPSHNRIQSGDPTNARRNPLEKTQPILLHSQIKKELLASPEESPMQAAPCITKRRETYNPSARKNKTTYQIYLAKAIKEANEEYNATKRNKTTIQEPTEEKINITGRVMESIEHLVIDKQVGQGAYAIVRVALDKRLNKKVALKIYDKSKLQEPQRQKSVQREIKIMEKLVHPRIQFFLLKKCFEFESH